MGIVLDACPNLREVAQGRQIRHWRDFLAAAETVRPMLGVSPSAWEDAKAVLGEQQAAITLAAIYQKGEQISSAGGYLRSLTDRAREGKFSTWPMIMALLRAKLDGSNAGGEDGARADTVKHRHDTEADDGNRLQVSDALRRSLDKPKWR